MVAYRTLYLIFDALGYVDNKLEILSFRVLLIGLK